MKKIIKLLFIVIAMAVITPTFTSCKEDEEEELLNPIVGTWEVHFPGWIDTFIFKTDGSFIEVATFDYNEYPKEIDNGSYTIKDGNILILYYNNTESGYDYGEFRIIGNTLILQKNRSCYILGRLKACRIDG